MKLSQVLFTVGMLVASLVGGAVGSVLLDTRVGAQTPGVVTTMQVNIIDNAGQLRATLSGQDERGNASLSFYDPAGQLRTTIGIDEFGSAVMRMLTAGGESRLLAMVQNDDALLVAGDESARTAVVGTIGGGPIVTLGDGNVPRARLQLDQSGAPFFALFDEQGQRGASMVVDASDSPFLTLYNEGRARVTFGVTQGAALMNISDLETPRIVAGVADNGVASLTFRTPSGEVEQYLPTPQREAPPPVIPRE